MKRKCQKVRIELPEEISDYIAEKLTSNIRELEGIINRIYAYQQLSNDEITMDFIKEILKNFLPEDASGDGKTDKKDAGADPAPQSSAAQAAVPPQVPPYMPQQQIANLCPNCSGQLTFVHQYQRWYCMNCRMYTEPHTQYQPQPQQFQPPPRMQPVHPPPPPGQMQGKACAGCSNQMRYISEYKRYYCDTCKQYEQQVGPPQQQPAPQGGEAPVPAPQAAQPAESAPAPAPQAAQPADNKDEKKTKKKEKDKETSAENKEKQTYDERVIGQEKKGIREIKAGYFLCEADDELFENIVAKLDDLTSRKRFNFFIRPLFKHYYYTGGDVNYDKMAHISKTTDIDIALCLKPSKESKIRSDEFKKKLETVMTSVEIPIEVISESEMKDSNALNFMLDIAICAKKRNSGG